MMNEEAARRAIMRDDELTITLRVHEGECHDLRVIGTVMREFAAHLREIGKSVAPGVRLTTVITRLGLVNEHLQFTVRVVVAPKPKRKRKRKAAA